MSGSEKKTIIQKKETRKILRFFIIEVLLFLVLLPFSLSVFTTFLFYLFFVWIRKNKKIQKEGKVFKIIDVFNLLAIGLFFPFFTSYFFSFTSFTHYYVFVLSYLVLAVFLNTFVMIDCIEKKRTRKRKIEAFVFLLIWNIACSYLFYEHNSLIRYDGERDDQGKMSGHGRWTYPDGDVYEGEWLNHKKHGKGVMIFSDGDKCKGVWEKGTIVKKLGCDKNE